MTSSQSVLWQLSSDRGQTCCKWTGQLSSYYLDVESSLTLPLIGKPAAVQTESLDRSPLLRTLPSALSRVVLQQAVASESSVSPSSPHVEKSPAAMEELVSCSWHLCGCMFEIHLLWQDFALISFISMQSWTVILPVYQIQIQLTALHVHLPKYSFEVCYYILLYFTVLPDFMFLIYFTLLFHYTYLQTGRNILSTVQTRGTLTNFIRSGWSLLCRVGVESFYQTVISKLKTGPLCLNWNWNPWISSRFVLWQLQRQQ